MYGAWLTPNGRWLTCKKSGDHNRIAKAMFCTEEDLERRGYAKLTEFHQFIMCRQSLSQKQVDTIFDFMVEYGYDVKALTDFCEDRVPYILLVKYDKDRRKIGYESSN